MGRLTAKLRANKENVDVKDTKPIGTEDVGVADRVLSHIPGVRSFFDLKEKKLNYAPRKIYANQPLPAEDINPKTGYPIFQYATNKIRTTKYTPLNFLPKNILFQFKNVANIYFLAVAILSGFSIFGVENAGLAAVPIIAIVAITALRDAIEDSRRQVLDLELNNSITCKLVNVKNSNVAGKGIDPWRKFKKACSRFYRTVWRAIRRKSIVNSDLYTISSRRSVETKATDEHIEKKQPKFKRDYWKNIQVGDFIKIFADDPVPADAVVLASSGQDGSCFIETRNLDGETNLKPREACRLTRDLATSQDFAETEFMVHVEGANSNLNTFGWTLIKNNSQEDALTLSNFIPRGSTLRNTRWVVAYVVYTGDETKIQLNAGETPTKRSRLTRDLNFYMIISFAFLFVFAFVAGVVEGVKFRDTHSTIRWFGGGVIDNNPALSGFVNFWAAVILLQNLIPISLYISIEIVRTVQAFFIYSDVQMYDAALNYPCTPKTWSISDDLGQIEFIFSDKTGTLTQNSMVFRNCTVAGKSYGVSYTAVTTGNELREGETMEDIRQKDTAMINTEKQLMLEKMHEYYNNPFLDADDLQLVSASIYSDLLGASGNQQHDQLHLFALALGLCNTVVTDTVNGKLQHKVESPDESALVTEARDLGYTLVDCQKDFKTINIRGEDVTYSVLADVMFTSARKRMSVLLQGHDGRTFVFCKGADNVILSRLNRDPRVNTPELVESTKRDLDRYANDGLRTLVFSYREVEPEWARGWCARFARAAASPDREVLVEKVSDELETELILLGGSGIEDELQEGVPETIYTMGQAGIKMWVLTGDKLETAVAIGYTCKLLQEGMEVLVALSAEKITEYLHMFGLKGTPEEVAAAAADHRPAPETHALVVDGETIAAISADPILTRQFALVGKRCKSVLCCRVSPSQKAVVVNIIKNTFDVTTLAIGDGANDVSMIQRADVGVGIVGVEGRQAAMSSDYAIGQFRFLKRLVLVHGHWSYMRICELTANLLYKNIVFTMTLFWYGVHNDFDCSYVFDYTYITLFNSVFTSLPVVFMGCLDQDIPDNVMLAVPQLYSKGILREGFTKKKFFIYAADGLYQSAVAYFFAYCCFFNGGFVTRQGNQINYRTAYGVFIATVAIIVCNFYVLINTHSWDWLIVLIVVLSSLLVFAWTGIYTIFIASNFFYKAAPEVYDSIPFWAELLMGIIVCLLPRICYMAVQKIWFPTDIDIVREKVALGEINPPDALKMLKEMETNASATPNEEVPKALESTPPTDNTHTADLAYESDDSTPVRDFYTPRQVSGFSSRRAPDFGR